MLIKREISIADFKGKFLYSAYALIDTIVGKKSVSIRANVSIRENVTISL